MTDDPAKRAMSMFILSACARPAAVPGPESGCMISLTAALAIPSSYLPRAGWCKSGCRVWRQDTAVPPVCLRRAARGGAAAAAGAVAARRRLSGHPLRSARGAPDEPRAGGELRDVRRQVSLWLGKHSRHDPEADCHPQGTAGCQRTLLFDAHGSGSSSAFSYRGQHAFHTRWGNADVKLTTCCARSAAAAWRGPCSCW